MDNFDSADMGKYNYIYDWDSNISRESTKARAPQLGIVPGQGGPSQGCQNIGEGSDDADGDRARLGGRHSIPPQDGYGDEGNVSDDDNESIDGQEGREDKYIRIPGCGYVTFKTIFTALARHEDCDCHTSPFPSGRCLSEPGTPKTPNGQSLSSSMMATRGDNSMESSTIWLPRSQTPSEFDFFIGSLLVDDIPLFQPTTLVFNPLPLNPEIILARTTEGPFYYPTELSFTEKSDDKTEMNRLAP